MLKQEHQNCWEYWDCTADMQKHCPVYKDKKGRECWIYTHNLKLFDWAKPERGFDSCLDCPWYKHLNKAKDES